VVFRGAVFRALPHPSLTRTKIRDLSVGSGIRCRLYTVARAFADLALYFHLYGLTRDEAAEILDTFPIVRRQDEARYDGKFRTRELILAYHNAYGAGNMDAWVRG
jgi:hypothetical protein